MNFILYFLSSEFLHFITSGATGTLVWYWFRDKTKTAILLGLLAAVCTHVLFDVLQWF
jgi:hypothetical protein